MDSLLPHRQVGEAERLGRILVVRQQLQSGLDPRQGGAAALKSGLPRLLVRGHVRLLKVRFPVLDPGFIRHQQWANLLVEVGGRRLAQFLHVQDQPGQLGEIGDPWAAWFAGIS